MKLGNSWAKAIVINAVILILMLIFTDMSYETNDDYAISVRTLMGDPYTYFVNYFLCRFMIWLQGLIPTLNAFVLVQTALSFVALTCISALYLGRDRSFVASLIFVLILAIYSFDHYSVVQFTKTSALLLTAGMLMLIDAMTMRLAPGYYIGALLLFYLGSCFRMQSAVIAVGFAGLFLIFWIVENRRELIPEGYLNPGRLCVYVILLMLLAGSFAFHLWSNEINMSTKALKDYQDYSYERSWVIDYSDFKNYDKHKAEFDEMGLSKNDLYLINNWYFDYDGAASYDNLKAIAGEYGKSRQADAQSIEKAVRKCVREIISDIKDLSATGRHIIILVAIALAGLFLLRPRYWIYIVALGAATIMIYAGLYYMGRPAYRALYGIDLNATLWLLWYFDRSRYWIPEKDDKRGIAVFMRGSSVVVGVAFMLVLACGIYLCADRSGDKHRDIVEGLRSHELTQEIDANKDKVYVFSTREKKNTEPYAYPMMTPDPDENVFTFGGWGTMSPYLLDRMEAYQLENLFEDIIDNENVYVIEKKNVDRMEEYFNKWYGDKGKGKIKYHKVKEVDGKEIWQVVREP